MNTKTDKISLSLRGQQLLENPLLNKGTAFTNAERDAFGLHGLLPDHVDTLDEQVARSIERRREFAVLSALAVAMRWPLGDQAASLI